tara:strand:+ start:147 stop:1109 length:963 start_codon:yes stop_codon:yes gene_type:complete
MANVIKLKRGTSTPTTSDIVDGEVAIDKSAQKFYVNDGGTVKEIGGGGGLTSDAQNNTVGGTNAGDSFSGTDATNNTLLGYNAGTDITTGDNNTFIGYNVGYDHESGFYNTCVGVDIKCGDGVRNNTLIGYRAGSVTDGSARQDTFVGSSAGLSCNSGASNTGIGNSCLYGLTSGNGNTFVGSQAGQAITSGSKNVGLGEKTLENLTTGSDNSALGDLAGDTLTTGSNNTFIGHNAVPSSSTVSNEITLGDTNITKLRIPALSFSISASAVTNGAAFYENAKTVAADYTLSGSNAMAAGPITINSSVTVTVSSGDTLTIV